MATTMKTNREILDNWDKEESLNDWFAVDSYDPATGRFTRLFVGDADSAFRMASERASGAGLVDYDGNPCEPGEFGTYPFFRATLIAPAAAHDYFAALEATYASVGEMMSITDAAKYLGVTRQAVHKMIERHTLEAELFGDEWRIGKYSLVLKNISGELGEWAYDSELNAVHKRGEGVYFDGERAFQMHHGERIAAASFGAFGDDAANARIALESFIEEAKAVWSALKR